MNLLSEMQLKVMDLLAPLLEDLQDYRVLEIQVQEFGSAADAEELLERFRGLLPGAFLSIPRVTYDTRPGGLRVADVTLNYGFLIGMADRRDEAIRQEFAKQLHERHSQHLMLRQLSPAGIACSGIDYLRPQSWEYTAEPEISVAYLTFDITVRNWQINTPA